MKAEVRVGHLRAAMEALETAEGCIRRAILLPKGQHVAKNDLITEALFQVRGGLNRVRLLKDTGEKAIAKGKGLPPPGGQAA